MKRIVNILVFLLGVIGFALIRFFETEIFYDPLIDFYDSKFFQKPFPELDIWLYNLNLIFRYVLNSAISLILIWVSFQNKDFIKFSFLLYSILFVICIILFWLVTYDIQPKSYMVLFYIRRFLIQPLFVIVLLPAFYFQQIQKKL